MNLKKLFVLAASFAFAAAGFVCADGYDDLLMQAEDYEADSQWIHALGTYWDAMEAGYPDNQEEAQRAFERLGNAIKGGFDEFAMFDGWYDLCKDYEAYWTEHCPLVFAFGDFHKEDVDAAARTGTYSIKISADWTKKYRAIENLVLSGFKSSYQRSWRRYIPENWPAESIYSDEDEEFYKDGIALVNPETDYGYGNNVPAALYSLSHGGEGGDMPTFYDIEFRVTDENGSALLISERTLVGIQQDYVFTDVPRKAMRVIDAGKARIVPTGVYLFYGAAEGYSLEDLNWIDSMSELGMDVRETKFDLPVSGSNDIDVLQAQPKLAKADDWDEEPESEPWWEEPQPEEEEPWWEDEPKQEEAWKEEPQPEQWWENEPVQEEAWKEEPRQKTPRQEQDTEEKRKADLATYALYSSFASSVAEDKMKSVYWILNEELFDLYDGAPYVALLVSSNIINEGQLQKYNFDIHELCNFASISEGLPESYVKDASGAWQAQGDGYKACSLEDVKQCIQKMQNDNSYLWQTKDDVATKLALIYLYARENLPEKIAALEVQKSGAYVIVRDGTIANQYAETAIAAEIARVEAEAENEGGDGKKTGFFRDKWEKVKGWFTKDTEEEKAEKKQAKEEKKQAKKEKKQEKKEKKQEKKEQKKKSKGK